MNCFVLWFFHLLCWTFVVTESLTDEVHFVDGGASRFCQSSAKDLHCDFGFATEIVRTDFGSLAKFESVTFKNTRRLILQDGFFNSLNLINISSVTFDADNDEDQLESGGQRALHLHNVTINYIPSNLQTLRMENSIMTGTFYNQPFLKNVDVIRSSIHSLELGYPLTGHGEIHLYMTDISLLGKVEMMEYSTITMTDCVIEDTAALSLDLILRHNSSAEFIRLALPQNKETHIYKNENARILMANFTGHVRLLEKAGVNEDDNQHGVSGSNDQVEPTDNIVTLAVILTASVVLNVCAFTILFKSRRISRKDDKIKTHYRPRKDEEDLVYGRKYVVVSRSEDVSSCS
ncbi:uncharacterized protein [Palaemon carinicauda]|uniref:uncharacterized protein n=1 Tax=Palaemon carinicauda TaxID=392227 RepID=UPI0035B67561